jgi:XTP/dITP diphosphohydrolase
VTLEGNALLKASFVHNTFNLDCFADDTGLEIDALNGKPGVFSARYAGLENNFEANVSKILYELKDIENRSARFRTVICLIINRKILYFDGTIEGAITKERRGNQGFGYDPVFIPNGYNLTFAEMSLEQKNRISHRAIATTKLLEFLNKTY